MNNKNTKELIEVNITSIIQGGDAIARYNDFVIFVPYAVPGDKLLVEIQEKKKNYAKAKIIKIIDPSKHRIKPRCKYYNGNCDNWCGGCNFMHIDMNAQLLFKKDLIFDAFKKFAKIENFIWEGIVESPKKNEYRNKIQIPFSKNNKGEIISGFYMPNTHRVIDLDSCFVQPKISISIDLKIKELLKKYNISVYNENNNSGYIRHVVIRINKNNQVMLIFVTNSMDNKPLKDISKDLIKEFSNIISIFQNINTKKTNVILGDSFEKIYGEDYLEEKIENITYKISPASFFQVNSSQIANLYSTIKDYTNVTNKDTVLDLYCGTGGSGLLLADSASKVLGIEVVDRAILDAKENAKINNINNVEYICAKVEDFKKENFGTVGIVIINPPRGGVSPSVIEFLKELSPKKIVYSSCNPVTLARDVDLLCKGGFTIRRVKAIDMFPETSEVETVVEIITN